MRRARRGTRAGQPPSAGAASPVLLDLGDHVAARQSSRDEAHSAFAARDTLAGRSESGDADPAERGDRRDLSLYCREPKSKRLILRATSGGEGPAPPGGSG